MWGKKETAINNYSFNWSSLKLLNMGLKGNDLIK